MRSRAAQLATRHERDRRQLELIGLRQARGVITRARIHTVRAWEVTRDPAFTVGVLRTVLRGDPRVEQLGLTPIYRRGLVAAHMRGMHRTLSTARVVELSRARSLDLAWTTYDHAIDFLEGRLKFSARVLDAIAARYESEALRVVEDASRSLEKKLMSAMSTSVSEGESVKRGVARLRGVFERAGYAPGSDWQLETIFRTETQKAYGAGRWASLQEPAIADTLWGFEYVAIMDDRARETHAAMSGVRAEKDDPVWMRWWPPNGWNCRCSTLELYTDERPRATRIPDVDPDEGFDMNIGKMFQSATEMMA